MSPEPNRPRDDRETRPAAEGGGSSAPKKSDDKSRTSAPQFLREVRGELRKVAWPDRHEVLSYTVVVLVTTLVLVAIVWAMDYVIREAVINTLG